MFCYLFIIYYFVFDPFFILTAALRTYPIDIPPRRVLTLWW